MSVNVRGGMMRGTTAMVIVAVLLGLALGVSLTWAELGPYAQTPAQLALDGAGVLIDASKPLPLAKVVGSDTFDFGFMEQDTQGKHVFEIRNDGDAPLTLTKGSTTCKCTLSNLQDESLEPGQTAKVELEWTASGAQPEFRHSASIRTNDPRHSFITFTIEGSISRTHKVVPQDLRYPSIGVGDTMTSELLLYSYETEKLEIKRYDFADKSTAGHFELRIEEMPAEQVAKETRAKGGKIVHLAIKPGLSPGPLRQTIRLWLELPGDPVVDVPIEGTVVGDISIIGPRRGRGIWESEQNLLVLGEVKSDAGAESQGLFLLVKGEHRDKVDLKVTEARPEFLQIEFEQPQPLPGEDVVKIPFTVKIPRGAPPGDHTGLIRGKAGKIELSTGHPTTPRLHLYVTFSVER